MAKKKPKVFSSIGSTIEENEKRKNNAINKLDEAKKEKSASLIEISKIDEINIFDSKQMHNRVCYSKEKLFNLAYNIEQLKGKGCLGTGVIQPIVVRKKGERFERISGFRRVEACKINKETHIPAIVLEDIDDSSARFMRSSENIEREENNPYDELIGILENIALLVGYNDIKQVTSFLFKVSNSNKGKSTLSDEDNKLYMQMSEIVKKLGKYSLSALTERLVILNFKESVLKELSNNNVNYTEAKLINRVKDENKIQALLQYVKTTKPTIKMLREQISNIKNNGKQKEQTGYDKLKKKLSAFKASDYKKLEGSKKVLVDKAIENINLLLDDIEKLVFER